MKDHSTPSENLRDAILQKKARIAEIERLLDKYPLEIQRLEKGEVKRYPTRPPTRLEEERQRLLAALPELERELESRAPIIGLVASSGSKELPELTDRDKIILDVIRRKVKSVQYCRELDRAGIRPRKTGAWKGCPGTYAGAYLLGQPWQKLIQDEKYKVARKGKTR